MIYKKPISALDFYWAMKINDFYIKHVNNPYS